MSVDRDQMVAAFWKAVAECDPARRVQDGLGDEAIVPLLEGRRRFGVAVGKAAVAMARGAGPVERGVIIAPARGSTRALASDAAHRDVAGHDMVEETAVDFADVRARDAGEASVPAGWRLIESAHPFVDERSVVAARAAREVIDAAGEGDVVLALISGGTSALIEEPIDGLSIAELGATTRAAMESGMPISELNDLRSTLSRVKRGGLVATCAAPVVTLAVSDVIGDGLAIIGSGPTIGPWFVDDLATRREIVADLMKRLDRSHEVRREVVARALEREREGEPFTLDDLPRVAGAAWRATAPRHRDVAMIVGHMMQFSGAVMTAFLPRMSVEYVPDALAGDVAACAKQIVDRVAKDDGRTYVWWGEPTLRVPEDHGEGGRAQQLALHLAKALRGTTRIAMAIGSDGIDGPPPEGRPAPAGAIVDGGTWDAIVAAGHDPERALARCDAGTVLDAVGALVVTGPTGINHADVVVIGERRE